MDTYTATVEVADRTQPTPEQLDDLIDKLATYHPSISTGPTGALATTITFPAENLTQATTTALTIAAQAFGADPIACIVMTETERDTRAGWLAPTDLVSITEAAEILGVTRQAVQQRIASGSLPATQVGRGWVLPRGAVERGKTT